MKLRAFTNSRGGVSIVTFAPQARQRGETDEQFIERIWAKMRNKDRSIPATFIDVDESSLPERFDGDGVSIRDTWKIDGNTIVIDNTKRNKFREIYDKEQQIVEIANKATPTNRDIVAMEKLKREVKDLQKEIREGNVV